MIQTILQKEKDLDFPRYIKKNRLNRLFEKQYAADYVT